MTTDPQVSKPLSRLSSLAARRIEHVDIRLSVRLTGIVDEVERLDLVRGRSDRLPAERLVLQLADDVRALGEPDGEPSWNGLADALAASATDPLGDELAEIVQRLMDRVAATLERVEQGLHP